MLASSFPWRCDLTLDRRRAVVQECGIILKLIGMHTSVHKLGALNLSSEGKV